MLKFYIYIYRNYNHKSKNVLFDILLKLCLSFLEQYKGIHATVSDNEMGRKCTYEQVVSDYLTLLLNGYNYQMVLPNKSSDVADSVPSKLTIVSCKQDTFDEYRR